MVTLFSPRTARLFAAEALSARWDLTRAVAVSLSAAADAGFAGTEPAARLIAAAPTREGMLAALAGLA